MCVCVCVPFCGWRWGRRRRRAAWWRRLQGRYSHRWLKQLCHWSNTRRETTAERQSIYLYTVHTVTTANVFNLPWLWLLRLTRLLLLPQLLLYFYCYSTITQLATPLAECWSQFMAVLQSPHTFRGTDRKYSNLFHVWTDSLSCLIILWSDSSWFKF